MIYRKENNGPIASIGTLLIMVAFMIGLFFVARFVFRILAFLSPVLLIAALILDYRTVLGYGKWLINLVRRNVLLGVGAILLTVFGFPLVSAFLAGKALLMRNVRQTRKEQEQKVQGEYIDFEEVDEEMMELPRLKERRREIPPAPKKEDNDSKYDQFFDEQ